MTAEQLAHKVYDEHAERMGGFLLHCAIVNRIASGDQEALVETLLHGEDGGVAAATAEWIEMTPQEQKDAMEEVVGTITEWIAVASERAVRAARFHGLDTDKLDAATIACWASTLSVERGLLDAGREDVDSDQERA